MSDFGITMWAKTPYSHDFAVGSNRPRKVISVDAMDATADWPTRVEELRFDAQDPSDVTWHRWVGVGVGRGGVGRALCVCVHCVCAGAYVVFVGCV